MVINIDFRKELKQIIEEKDDTEVIKFILSYAIGEYPLSTIIWFYKHVSYWDLFSD